MMGAFLMNFPERLKNLRVEKRVTQVMLAQVTGLTDRTFRKYESGKIEPTSHVVVCQVYEDNFFEDIFSISPQTTSTWTGINLFSHRSFCFGL
jgi:DNA-binding XRE family transcriptional regulator